MKKNKYIRPKHTRRNIVLLVLLALLCISAAELIACRHFAPELYQRITDPFRRAAAQVSQFVGDTADRVAQFWADLTAPKETPAPTQPPDDQLDGQVIREPDLVDREPVTDPAITELLEEGGRQVLTGGSIDIVFYCQSDEPWADKPYGADTIGPYGCGPTAMAMAVASMTETETDPAAMAAWAVSHGYWASRSGSYHSIVPGAAKGFGLEAESFSPGTPEELRSALISGKILVALMGPGHFTRGGHFILLRGVTLTGDILVADPNSLDRSLTVWDPQIILDELAVRASSGGPLWALSKPASGIEGAE